MFEVKPYMTFKGKLTSSLVSMGIQVQFSWSQLRTPSEITQASSSLFVQASTLGEPNNMLE